jgi:hypothetical protein
MVFYIEREVLMPAQDVQYDIDWGKNGKVLSENTKVGRSLNFPIEGYCHPSVLCEVACYAKTGRLAMTASTTHQQKVAQYFNNGDMTRLIAEVKKWKYASIRISASGDLIPAWVPHIIKLAQACPNSMFWGMTKKAGVAYSINKEMLPNLALLVSLDSSTFFRPSGQRLLDYVDNGGFYCYTEVCAETIKKTVIAAGRDAIRAHLDDEDIIEMYDAHAQKHDAKLVTVFPEHKGGRVLVSRTHPKDCPAIRDKVEGCWQCGKCWNSFPWIEGGRFMNGASKDIDPSLPMPENW